MRAHLEDKIRSKVDSYRSASDQKKVMEARRVDALALGRDIAAQHLAVEIGIVFADLQAINMEIKDMQREIYFFDLEISRKDMIMQKLKTDIDVVKRQVEIEKKLSAKIKKEVNYSISFNFISRRRILMFCQTQFKGIGRCLKNFQRTQSRGNEWEYREGISSPQ